MTRLKTKLLSAAMLTMLFALFTPLSPSARITDLLPTAPDPRELAILEELADWVGDDGEVITTSDLGEAIREHRDSFELFRYFHDDSDRREQLLDLPFGKEIAGAAERYGIDGLLLASVIQAESNFNPAVVSPVGAIGLMQVMPATAGAAGAERLHEPGANLAIGARYLAWLLDEFQGDLELALAAYNAGPGAVRRFDGVPPFRETRNYVSKVLSIYVEHHRLRWHKVESGLLALL